MSSMSLMLFGLYHAKKIVNTGDIYIIRTYFVITLVSVLASKPVISSPFYYFVLYLLCLSTMAYFCLRE